MAAAAKSTPTRIRTGRRPSPRLDQYRRTWYLLRRNTLALIGLGILLSLIVLAIYAITLPIPWNTMNTYCETKLPGCTYVCTYSAGAHPASSPCYQVNPLFPSFIAPTLSVTAGTGLLPLGSLAESPAAPHFYNIVDGIARGADWSLLLAFSIVVAGAVIGLTVGAISGFFGGAIDETLMRLVDIFLSIPQILFVIITVSVFTTFTIPGLTQLDSRIVLLILAFIVVWWPFYARIVRGQVLVVREQKYVEAARASGAGKGRIVLRHVMPNSVYPVFIQMSLDVGTVPLLVGALSFLGFDLFGLPTSVPFPEWGSISAFSVIDFSSVVNACSEASCVFPWWQIFFTGLMLFLFAISVNFFSDGLRDALDPRLRR